MCEFSLKKKQNVSHLIWAAKWPESFILIPDKYLCKEIKKLQNLNNLIIKYQETFINLKSQVSNSPLNS